MLVGIEAYRRAIARVVRRERRRYDLPVKVDIDVSVANPLYDDSARGIDWIVSEDHRQLACEARAEFWKRVRNGEITNDDDSTQVFEEWSHTE